MGKALEQTHSTNLHGETQTRANGGGRDIHCPPLLNCTTRAASKGPPYMYGQLQGNARREQKL